jgi:magnesium-transporting ATPase (P-type)
VRSHSEDVHAWEKDNKKHFDCFVKNDDIKAYIDQKDQTIWEFLPQKLEAGTATQKCLHFTFVFQAFVFMQVFNQINARKLELGENNVFSGIFRNMLFIYITIFTFVIQMAMVEYGGAAVKSYPLNTQQNLICLCIGAVELIVGFIVKFMPLKLFQCISIDERPASQVPGNTMASVMKRSSVLVKK